VIWLTHPEVGVRCRKLGGGARWRPHVGSVRWRSWPSLVAATTAVDPSPTWKPMAPSRPMARSTPPSTQPGRTGLHAATAGPDLRRAAALRRRHAADVRVPPAALTPSQPNDPAAGRAGMASVAWDEARRPGVGRRVADRRRGV